MHGPRMKSSPHRPRILKRRKLPLSHEDASDRLAGEDNGSISDQQARTGEHSTSRKTPGSPMFPTGIKKTSHPATSGAQVTAVSAGTDVQPVVEALAAKENEWGNPKPDKFILISSGSSSPTREEREFNQLFESEDEHSIPCNKALEEDEAGPSPRVMTGAAVWASESPSMEEQEQEGKSSREAPSCELDNSLTNIQWLGKMSSDGLRSCSVKNGTEKENQTPKQEAAVKMEDSAAPFSSHASWLETFSERPPYSYMAMIQFAINSTEKKCMTLKDIYTWIEDHFPYFKHVAKPGWKNSIRHNLSLHDMFVRETSANSKTSFWTIHPEANRYLTLDQVFKQQKRHTPDLLRTPGNTSGNRTQQELHPTCRKIKPLLPRINSYLVPIQFPLSPSLVLQPSAKIPLLVSQSMSEPVQSSKRVCLAPKTLPASEKPTLFLPEVSIKEEVSCREESSSCTFPQSTKEDACQIKKELYPALLSIKKENDSFHSDEWATSFQTSLTVEEPPLPGDEELNLLLPVSEKQKRQLVPLEWPFPGMPDTKRHELQEISRSRRKQHLALPLLEEPVLLLPSSHGSDSFTLEHNFPFEQEVHPLGNVSHHSCSQEGCGPFKTPVKEMFCTQPACSPPCKMPTKTSSLVPTDPWRPVLQETGTQDFSWRRSPPIPPLSPQQNVDLSTSPRPPRFDSPQALLLNTEANDMVSGPLMSSPVSSHRSPLEAQASLLPENCSLQEGLFLDTMNESLSKIPLDTSFSGFDEDMLGTDLSWSQLIPDLK